MRCGYYLLYSVIHRNSAHLKGFLHQCRAIIYHWQYVCMYINHNLKYNNTNIELINQHKFYLQILHTVEYNTFRMNKQIKFHFNPFKEGLNQVLGALEKDIMEVLWTHGESSVKDILDAFSNDRDTSYSKVITVTNRMAQKGLLKKRKVGKAYFYKPIYDREQFYEFISKKVVAGVSEFF